MTTQLHIILSFHHFFYILHFLLVFLKFFTIFILFYRFTVIHQALLVDNIIVIISRRLLFMCTLCYRLDQNDSSDQLVNISPINVQNRSCQIPSHGMDGIYCMRFRLISGCHCFARLHTYSHNHITFTHIFFHTFILTIKTKRGCIN